MADKDILIDLAKISFFFPDGKRVLEDLDLCLHKNERLGLIGPNGSGKTTLFRLIMGLLKPASGRLTIFGREMVNKKDFIPVRQRIGLLFQDADDQLFNPTVLDDVAFGPLNQGKSPEEAKEISREILASLGLDNFEDRITYKLSGGEKKLVSLATVLAMKPEVLLLDEPTTGLDIKTTKKIIRVLESIDVSSIVISHDMDFIQHTTETIYGMVNGKIQPDRGEYAHSHIHAHGHGEVPHTHSDIAD
ncbi:MAG: ABC transporter ATP-binding protein [Deltaproteobacteria bacterium]|nr:ABC transporter ATP-binding protein [Deltaproteobacteria bacterium]